MKARATFDVTTGKSPPFSLVDFLFRSAFAASGNSPVSTTLAASTSFTLDSSLFTVPSSPTPFAVDDFGYLQITALQDNDLNACGTSGHAHCGSALIRMYTTGAPGAGLWNTVDQFGAPITAGQASLSTVGLNAAGAAIMQQIQIPSGKHTIKLSDFANPKYDLKVDFTDAGAGAYATTIVVEYALARGDQN